MARVRDHVRGVIEAIAPNDSAERFTALGVRVIKAEARFTGPDTVAAGDVVVRARRFVLATGSRPSAPPIPGLDQVPYLTNETRLRSVASGRSGSSSSAAGRSGSSWRRPTAASAPRSRSSRRPASCPATTPRWRRCSSARSSRTGSSSAPAISDRAGRAAGRPRRRRAPVRRRAAIRRRQPPSRRGRAAAGHRGARARGRRHRLRQGRHHRRQAACAPRTGASTPSATAPAPGGGPYKFTHVANYHAGLVIRSALFRLPVQVDTARDPARDLHRSGARLGRHDRGGGAREPDGAIRILRWPFAENDRAQAGAAHRRPCEGRSSRRAAGSSAAPSRRRMRAS